MMPCASAGSTHSCQVNHPYEYHMTPHLPGRICYLANFFTFWMTSSTLDAFAGWSNANIAFMRSGGYSVSKDIPRIQQDTIIFWGANDEILDKENVERFSRDLPHSR